MSAQAAPEIGDQHLLLLSCLSALDGRSPITELESFSSPDWNRIYESGARHGLTALLYYRLKTLDLIDIVPTEIAGKLRNTFLLNARRNLLRFEELKQLVAALDAARIPAMPLKGAHLAGLVYDDPALRAMGDLDLLLPRHALPAAVQAVEDFGYEPYRPFDIDDECTRMQHLPPMSKPGASTAIEIHWHIIKPGAPFPIEIESFWHRTRREQIAGVEMHTLAPEDLLVHLTIHVAYQHHYTMGLSALYDIHTLMRRYAGEIDWGALVERCQGWGIDRILFLTLKAVDALLGTSPPQDLLATMQPAGYQPWILEAALAQVVSGRPELSINLAELMDDTGALDAARRLLGRIFPPPDVMRREYKLQDGAVQLGRAYLKRLRSITRTNASAAWRLFTGDPQMAEQSRLQNEIVQVRDWFERA